MGPVVGALVGDLVGALVGPLVVPLVGPTCGSRFAFACSVRRPLELKMPESCEKLLPILVLSLGRDFLPFSTALVIFKGSDLQSINSPGGHICNFMACFAEN